MKKTNLNLLFLSFLMVNTQVFSMVIDTFKGVEFVIQEPGDSGVNALYDSPVGRYRSASIASRLSENGSTVICSADPLNEALLLEVNGFSSQSGSMLNMSLSYYYGSGYMPDPYSLQGYDGFELDFSAISGTGFIMVEVGQNDGIGTSAEYWTPLNTVGTLFIPISLIAEDGDQSADSFRNLHFTFVAESEQFSFTLDEIRVVPEPSSLLLLLAGAGLLFIRRVRKR